MRKADSRINEKVEGSRYFVASILASQLALSCKARVWLAFVANSPTHNSHLVDNEHVSKCLNFIYTF